MDGGSLKDLYSSYNISSLLFVALVLVSLRNVSRIADKN